MRTYSELIKLQTYEDRFKYLMIRSTVGEDTFGWKRYLNQVFYHDRAWKAVRDYVCYRDSDGDDVCDLGIRDRPITGQIYVHHMNPITEEDILNRTESILDPEFLIAVSFDTHNAIHYGDERLLIHEPVVRVPNDTCPWR